jgi:hypothetical protein
LEMARGKNLRPLPPNPVHDDPLPAGWPEYGTYRGKRIKLTEVVRTLDSSERAAVIVDIPGQGKCLPWKGSDVCLDEDGNLYL